MPRMRGIDGWMSAHGSGAASTRTRRPEPADPGIDAAPVDAARGRSTFSMG